MMNDDPMTRSPDTPRPLRAGLLWLAVLAAALVLLSGRYDWSAGVREYSWHAYASSAYMLVITLPVLYYLLAFFTQRRLLAALVTAAAALAASLPYRWLGLERFYYCRNHPAFWPNADPGSPPATDWLPGSLRDLHAMPHEGLIFALLVAAGVGVALVYWRRGRAAERLSGASPQTPIWFWLGIYLLIVLQTWLHLGLRSPYVYLTHYEKPLSENYWYVSYLFPGGMGASNADYVVFRDLEEYFMGIPRELNNMLMRRSYVMYVSSQFSYFHNPFYFYLGLNVALWFGACCCGYHYARPLFNERIARYFAFLIGCGPGFIMYAAQPMNYVAGLAAVIILLFLLERLIVCRPDTQAGTPAPPAAARNCLLYGGALGIASMVYDLFPLYPLLLIYVWYRRAPVRWLCVSLAVALAMYFGFLILQTRVLGVAIVEYNAAYIGGSFDNICHLFQTARRSVWYSTLLGFLANYVSHLGYAFFAVPLFLAVLGALFGANRQHVRLALLLAFPSFGAAAFLYFGGSYLATMPRFVYIAYPSIYLLAAVFIDELRAYAQAHAPWLPAQVAPALLLAPVFALNNVDVFGYPQMYYWFYQVRAGQW